MKQPLLRGAGWLPGQARHQGQPSRQRRWPRGTPSRADMKPVKPTRAPEPQRRRTDAREPQRCRPGSGTSLWAEPGGEGAGQEAGRERQPEAPVRGRPRPTWTRQRRYAHKRCTRSGKLTNTRRPAAGGGGLRLRGHSRRCRKHSEELDFRVRPPRPRWVGRAETGTVGFRPKSLVGALSHIPRSGARWRETQQRREPT